MRKNSHILITAAAALMLSFSVFPAYAATTGAIVGAPGAGISTEQASAPTSAGAAVPTTAAETKSAWESAAALEEVEKTGFVPALPLGDSIFSTPTGSGQTSETKAPETTAAKSTAAAETQAPVETTAAKTTAAAPETTEAKTTAAETTAAKTSGSAEVVGTAPTDHRGKDDRSGGDHSSKDFRIRGSSGRCPDRGTFHRGEDH